MNDTNPDRGANYEAQLRERQRLMDLRREAGFQRFLANPAIRLILSRLPPADPPESTSILLQTAYDAGFSEGQVDVVMGMIVPPGVRP